MQRAGFSLSGTSSLGDTRTGSLPDADLTNPAVQ
jgi:hypothetical protein